MSMEAISGFAKAVVERLHKQQPFVVYRKPGDLLLRAWFPDEVKLDPVMTEARGGFVFSPFDPESPSVLYPEDASKILEAPCGDYPFRTKKDGSSNKLNRFLMSVKKGGQEAAAAESERSKHEELVSETIKYIRSGTASKVVISRRERLEVDQLDPLYVFGSLIDRYPQAFAYLWFHPGIGMWAGASPEMLLSIRGEAFRTMALAGTRVWREGVQPAWGKKEKKEQRLVTEMIQQELGKSLEGVGKPYSQRAGHLVHLRTDIEGRLRPGTLPYEIIGKLHPTAAICGMPRKEAREFIDRNEGYSREYYTGYLGELMVTGKKHTNLFVNLRCMKLDPKENEVWIYVGGGITEASQAEREWEETVSKSQVMKAVFS